MLYIDFFTNNLTSYRISKVIFNKLHSRSLRIPQAAKNLKLFEHEVFHGASQNRIKRKTLIYMRLPSLNSSFSKHP